MNNQTYFIITRNIFDSAIWRENPHVLKLFIYLIGTARHSSKPKHYPSVIIQRGELVTSLQQIVEDNEYFENGAVKQWSRAKVSRILHRLSDKGYITLKSDTYGTHISICNYDTYQSHETYKPDSDETQVKHVCNTYETQVKTNNNGNNGNKNIPTHIEPGDLPKFFQPPEITLDQVVNIWNQTTGDNYYSNPNDVNMLKNLNLFVDFIKKIIQDSDELFDNALESQIAIYFQQAKKSFDDGMNFNGAMNPKHFSNVWNGKYIKKQKTTVKKTKQELALEYNMRHLE